MIELNEGVLKGVTNVVAGPTVDFKEITTYISLNNDIFRKHRSLNQDDCYDEESDSFYIIVHTDDVIKVGDGKWNRKFTLSDASGEYPVSLDRNKKFKEAITPYVIEAIEDAMDEHYEPKKGEEMFSVGFFGNGYEYIGWSCDYDRAKRKADQWYEQNKGTKVGTICVDHYRYVDGDDDEKIDTPYFIEMKGE